MSRYLPWVSGTCPGGRASLRDGPRLTASQVRSRHRILVIRAARPGLRRPETERTVSTAERPGQAPRQVPRTSGVPDADHVAPEQRGRAGVIASELSVSVNTVNTHVRNIYAKLQARDRSSAVQRARELRLLSAGLTR